MFLHFCSKFVRLSISNQTRAPPSSATAPRSKYYKWKLHNSASLHLEVDFLLRPRLFRDGLKSRGRRLISTCLRRGRSATQAVQGAHLLQRRLFRGILLARLLLSKEARHFRRNDAGKAFHLIGADSCKNYSPVPAPKNPKTCARLCQNLRIIACVAEVRTEVCTEVCRPTQLKWYSARGEQNAPSGSEKLSIDLATGSHFKAQIIRGTPLACEIRADSRGQKEKCARTSW